MTPKLICPTCWTDTHVTFQHIATHKPKDHVQLLYWCSNCDRTILPSLANNAVGNPIWYIP